MIVYRDMTFCSRKGCKVRSCRNNLAHVDWSAGLPVSMSDFWGKSNKCPEKEPEMIEFEDEEDEDE